MSNCNTIVKAKVIRLFGVGARVIVVGATLFALPNIGIGQTVAQGWTCADAVCVETDARVIATYAGTFAEGSGLTGDKDADRIAALEQQSQREFELSINQSGVFFARLMDASEPSETVPEVQMWTSADGKNYRPIKAGTALKSGKLLLVAVRQARRENDGVGIYRAATWTLEILQKRQLPLAELRKGVPTLVLPTQVSADGDPDPNDLTGAAPDVPGVDGSARLKDISAPCDGTGCDALTPDAPTGAASNGLAIELQSELARVGCYLLAIDGLWGPASRRALDQFNQATAGALSLDPPSARALVAVSQTRKVVCSDE